MFLINLFLLVFVSHFFHLSLGYTIKLNCDNPIVKGAILNCTTKVFDDDNKLADGAFDYFWYDDAIPQHLRRTSGSSIDTWSVSYNATVNGYGSFVIRVEVCRWEYLNLFCKPIDSTGIFFQITDTLNGHLDLNQKNTTRQDFISTSTTVNHTIALKKSDQEYIAKAPTVLSYWFIDCVYYGISNDLQFQYNYSEPNKDHIIEALVMADFTPLPPPITTTVPPSTTTTTKPNTTTKVTTTTAKPSTTTKSTTTSTTPKLSSTVSSVKSKREVGLTSVRNDSLTPSVKNDTQSNIMVKVNGSLVPYNGTFPYVCNGTFVATDNTKVYGYFERKITTKAPISNVTVTGNNWLQHGDLLSLNVNCRGSQEMQYCLRYINGQYNVTGNETCRVYYDLDRCDFPIKRYFVDPTKHTVLIIIKNDVSIKVTPVTVTVYKVNKQAQLSVIVVPVAFSLVSVVTIVFGVAYYIQNRSRFVVEVADFDFGQQYADMEYKTFRDRLRDSIMNAFTRDPTPSTSEAPIWPPGHKYGSMT